jgi:hypothetical protein
MDLTPKRPSSLNGSNSSKKHPVFTTVIDWSLPQPHLPDLSIYLREELFRRLPELHVFPYINNPFYDEDGFSMLQHFLDRINPDSSSNKLRTLKHFSSLSFPTSMSGQEFLSKGRGLAQAMCSNLDPEELVVMQMINVFESDGRYEGIVSKYIKGDLLSCKLDRLGTLMDDEDARMADRSCTVGSICQQSQSQDS